MRRLRLLYTIQGKYLGGAELHAIDLARRMAERGHEVIATCRSRARNIRRALEAAADHFHEVCFLDTYLEAAALIDRVQPQVIQHFNTLVAPAAVELARHKPSSVQIIHANYRLDPAYRPTPTDGTNFLIAVSESSARHYPVREGTPPLQVILNGVDTRDFVPAGEPPASLPVRLLAVGRLEEAAKRPLSLIRACAALPRSGWQLTWVGDGPDRDSIQRAIDHYGLGNVELVTHQDDLASYYRSAHIYLSCSPSEGFGLSLAEAAASGLAILAMPCQGVTELFQHGIDALISESDLDFSRELRRLLGDGALRRRLGCAAHRLALGRLTVDRMVEEYEYVYEELVEGSTGSCKQHSSIKQGP